MTRFKLPELDQIKPTKTFKTPKIVLEPAMALPEGVVGLVFNPPDIPVAVLLNGIYIADDHDPTSPHGEFYWTSEVADGRKVSAMSSGDRPTGNISSGQWLPVRRRLPIHVSDGGPPAKEFTLQFRLFESDDRSTAIKILEQGGPFLGEAVKRAVEAYTGGAGGDAAKKITEGAVEIFTMLLGADGDDTVIDARSTHYAIANHYKVGRFIRFIEGSSGSCAAIFSVVPAADLAESEHYFEFESDIAGLQTFTYEVPVAGRLSYFVRKPHYPGFPKTRIEVVKRGGGFRRVHEFNWWQIKNYVVEPGTYDFKVLSYLPADLEVMFTAFGDTLAQP